MVFLLLCFVIGSHYVAQAAQADLELSSASAQLKQIFSMCVTGVGTQSHLHNKKLSVAKLVTLTFGKWNQGGPLEFQF